MAFPQNSIPGIDVSHVQSVVDWPTVFAGGEVFAFAKATEGLTLFDPHFHDSWLGMKQAGLLRGAYHFYRANDDPAAQATHFLDALARANGATTLAPGDLPVTLDLEVTMGVPSADILAGAARWLDLVGQATGRTPILYTFVSFWQQIGNPTVLSNHPLWIAEYGVAAPKQVGGWPHATFWQFSGKTTIRGVSGHVDGDAYQGNIAGLRALAGL